MMINKTAIQFFHWYYPADGSLWKHVCEKVEELAQLGFSAVWLPPATKGEQGENASGYDIYDLYDLGEFDQKRSVRTKYGTKEEYVNAVRVLGEKGIGVYADIVLNHKAGGDELERISVRRVNPENRTEFLSDPLEIDAYTKFTFPGRQGKYSAFVWDFRCFTGIDYAADLKETGLFSIVNEYGNGWEEVVAREKGNYDYLMFADIEFRNPAVCKELKSWGKWFMETAPFAGVRLDAVKHMSPGFINEWLDYMRSLKNDFYAVGEYWAPEDLEIVEKYIEATDNRLSIFDGGLQRNFLLAGEAGKKYDLREIFKNSLLSKKPELAATIVGNHDTQPLQMLQAPVQDWFKPLAYSLLLLRKDGEPFVFYPDLYGAAYTGKDADGNEQNIQLEKCAGIEELLMARLRFAYGTQRDYFETANCIGWTREGVDEMPGSGCAVVLSNGDASVLRMEIGIQHAGKYFYDFLGWNKQRTAVDERGWADFPVGAGTVAVWVGEDNRGEGYPACRSCPTDGGIK